MQIDLTALKAWLLGTVWGVIVLGALGSVVGSLFWLFVRSMARRMVHSSQRLLVALAYTRFGRHIEIGEQVRAKHTNEAREHRYLTYVVYTATAAIIESMVAVTALAGTVAIAVTYGIDRPILLVLAISLTVPLVLGCLRSGVYLLCLVDESIQQTQREAEASQPKRYRDYAKKKHESSAGI